MRIDIVADVTCPWCFIGKRRLDKALAMRPELHAQRNWRPFQLSPDMPAQGLPREVYLMLKFGGGRSAGRVQAALAAAGAREGIAFAFERIARAPNTLDAHRLVRFAAAEGRADALVEALFRAYFCDGRDIGDIDVLAALAGCAGLDPAEARTYLRRGKGAAEVLADEQRVRRSGIDAVPTFILEGDYALAGAQDPEVFLPLFDLAATARPAA